MRYLLALPIAVALATCGCSADFNKTAENPDVGVTVNRTPDMDPRTDHDVDVRTPDVDVDVNRVPGRLPDVDIDIGEKRDADTKANELPGSDPDPTP
jgi:hypothetical protein